MKYIIYSDIDGTFYSHKQEINPDTLKDIAYAQSNGVTFVLATGNPFFKQAVFVNEITKADYFIASNGSMVLDTKNNKVIFEKRIPNDITENIKELSLKNN